MSCWSKSFLLIILILFAIIPNENILLINPVSAQSNVAPTISIVYPTNNTFFNVSIEGVFFHLTYQTNSTLSWAGFSIDGGQNITATGNSTSAVYNEEFRNEYMFENSGYHTLTLYANDTTGNWATPQTVTYQVAYHPDITGYPSTPSPIVTSSQLLTVVVTTIIALAVIIVFFMLYRKHRKTSNR
jgi:hypothetical protein